MAVHVIENAHTVHIMRVSFYNCYIAVVRGCFRQDVASGYNKHCKNHNRIQINHEQNGILIEGWACSCKGDLCNSGSLLLAKSSAVAFFALATYTNMYLV